ncbi:unnamed protein product [Rodentolepis nana]|uniref:Uncharacterized protein n=1 Tax=Rodentolepis nana TaxID=102285 RepID=A0A0R3TS97_RODNA|nr:unnamed protein product [Rodentolepis nana]
MNSFRLLIVIAIAVALFALLYQPVQANRITPEEVGLEEIYDLDDFESPFFVDRRGFLSSSRLGRRKKGFLTAGRLGR